MAVRSPPFASLLMCASLGSLSASACATGGGAAIGERDGEEEVESSSGAGGIEDDGAGGAGGAAEPASQCDDGIANGTELGVDCGGTCPACCEPTSYDKSTELASGTVTVCCDDGDAVAAVVDCGVGDNHGVKVDGACGVGFEGAANNGSACVTITCQGGCDAGDTTSSSASTSGSSGGADPSSCAHDACETGEPLEPTCDPCVASVCAGDAYCCDAAEGAWDGACVGLVQSVCNQTC